jgi:endoglucanase
LRGENYTIDPDLMNRVEEIVKMALDSGLYAIVNIHYDYGWALNFSSDYKETMTRYTRYWDQISERFNKYGDHLVFESMNEEGYYNDVWNRYTDGNTSPKKQKAFDILNGVNQAFVDLVRAKGGNNATRYLLIAGYATDIDLTCSKEFKMPKDKVKHGIVSVHYYTPSTFSIISEDANWGKSVPTWGTPDEVALVSTDLGKVKAHFMDKGIPVIIGEYGTVIKNKDPESVRKYLTTIATVAWKMGMCPMLWAGATDVYNRTKLSFDDPAIGDMYLKLSQSPR